MKDVPTYSIRRHTTLSRATACVLCCPVYRKKKHGYALQHRCAVTRGTTANQGVNRHVRVDGDMFLCFYKTSASALYERSTCLMNNDFQED